MASSPRAWLQIILQSVGMGGRGPRLAVSKGMPVPDAADGCNRAVASPETALASPIMPISLTRGTLSQHMRRSRPFVCQPGVGGGPPRHPTRTEPLALPVLTPSQSSINKINPLPICFQVHLRSIKNTFLAFDFLAVMGVGGDQEWKNGGDRNELQSSFSLSVEGQ